jgi:hypothetical protein
MTAPRIAPPPAAELTYEQYAGRACVWCGVRLTKGAVSAGIARGQLGAVCLDIEVWACPQHANGPNT